MTGSAFFKVLYNRISVSVMYKIT